MKGLRRVIGKIHRTRVKQKKTTFNGLPTTAARSVGSSSDSLSSSFAPRLAARLLLLLLIIINIIIVFIAWYNVVYKDKCYRGELSNFQLHTRVIPSARVLANSTGFCEGDVRLNNDDWGIATAGRRPQIRLYGHLSSCKEFSRINHAGSSIFSPSAAAATFKFIL